ncbi:hypothetical protein CMMCAS05_08225 [Clavibacter michiganensis subsp. michiganensis]|nr:hypothetical protein CMMCAS04_09755 [Clavibacter michiganensis subsp. michiganensis]OUD92263.1 hypothetical protein CMMCAS05_08225 [Clavibacter michiganensis subsp. michiganensis]
MTTSSPRTTYSNPSGGVPIRPRYPGGAVPARARAAFGAADRRAIEARYPETPVRETGIPRFEQRDIRFHVNRCRFRTVESSHPGNVP